MADTNNALVLNDNENGTKSAEWTPIDEVPADKKVLMGSVDPLSGNIAATWEPIPVTPGVEFDSTPAEFTLLKNIRNLSVDIPEGVTSIGTGAFNSCAGLVSVTFPESGLTTIGGTSFQNCTGLTSLDIPGSVTTISSSAFNGCSGLTELTLNEGLTTIGSGAFYGCSSLETVDIPEGVTSLGENSFRDAASLTAITIPSTVTSIGQRSFNGCSSLETITINKAEGSITGAPWGAPETTQIIWTGE